MLVPLLLAAAVAARAQEADMLTDFASKAAESRVSFDYSYIADDGKVNMTGKGSVVSQDSTYYISADVLRIWCDGHSLWTVDDSTKEVLVENLKDASVSIPNPLVFFTDDFDENLRKTGEEKVVFMGHDCLKYNLMFKYPSDIQTFALYFSEEDSALIGAVFGIEKTTLVFEIGNLSFAAPSPMSLYDLSRLDSSYFVTDLR